MGKQKNRTLEEKIKIISTIFLELEIISVFIILKSASIWQIILKIMGIKKNMFFIIHRNLYAFKTFIAWKTKCSVTDKYIIYLFFLICYNNTQLSGWCGE